MDNSKSTLWVDEFRPKKLEDYVWMNDSMRSQVEAWIKERDLPHLVLSGGPGCGKNSVIGMIMNEMQVEPTDIRYVNASLETGINYIRDLVSFIETMPSGNYHYIILDEADRLSIQAKDSLKSLIEEYSSICRWILITNRPHMLTGPMFSRLQGFHIDSLNREQFVAKVANILFQKNIEINEKNIEILDEYVTVTYPDLRRCINMLQQNCKTGVLKRPDGSGTKAMGEYMVEAVSLFKNGRVHEARKIICENAVESEFEEIYKLLYRNLNWWGKDEATQHKAIVIIANRLKDHALVADPEIAMAACLVELSML